MGKSAAANWSARWARAAVPDRSSNRSLMEPHKNCKYCAAGVAEPHQPEPTKRSNKGK